MSAMVGKLTRLIGLAAVVALSGALGEGVHARPSTLAMSCGDARSMVARQGAIVLGTGGYTYDRFVRDASFCQPTEVGRRAFVPTRDAGACLIGYTCYEPSRNDRFGTF